MKPKVSGGVNRWNNDYNDDSFVDVKLVLSNDHSMLEGGCKYTSASDFETEVEEK